MIKNSGRREPVSVHWKVAVTYIASILVKQHFVSNLLSGGFFFKTKIYFLCKVPLVGADFLEIDNIQNRQAE